MTTYELSKKLKLSFPTTKKYIQTLIDKGAVIEDKLAKNNKATYKLNFKLLKDVKSNAIKNKSLPQDKSTQKIIATKKNSVGKGEILRTADLFAGVGGIRLAFEREGFKTVFANDFDRYCKIIYDANFPEPKMTLGDINDIDLKSIPSFEILLGGFPCQPFSIAGYRKGFKDAKGRGNLFFRIAEILDEKKPKAFLLENVKNLRNHDGGRTFEIISKTLHDLGYVFKVAILNSANYGNMPQNRERIFIVGFRNKKAYDAFEFPKELALTTSFKDFLETEPVDDKYYYNEKPLYERIVNDVNNENTVYQWRRGYVRANKKGLVPTLTANMGAGGHNVAIIKNHKGIRKFTPRECYSLQGFPKSFKLPAMADSQLYHQAGNSVTVPVLQRIAKEMKKALS
jgi:DNA (cytosine-5)-methyltransferase 1